MSRSVSCRMGLALAVSSLSLSMHATAQSPITYPPTRKDSTVDKYFGVMVADPYRWLEDQNSTEVAKWVDAQNKVAFAYLATIPLRDTFRQELTTFLNVPRVSVPLREAGKLYFNKNSGLQNQPVFLEQTSLDGLARPLIDPNQLSPDGSVSVSGFSPSPDGKYLAYRLSAGGSTWSAIHIRSLATLRELADTVHWVRGSLTSWTKDSKGFFYRRYPTPARDSILTAKRLNAKIYYHVVATPDSQDRLIYERLDHPDWNLGAWVSEDGRYLSIQLLRGTAEELLVADLNNGMRPDIGAPIVPLYAGSDAEYSLLGNVGDRFFLQTTAGAPKRKIVSFRLADTARTHWHVVVPEGSDVLESSTLAGGRIVTLTLEDVKSRLRMFALDGKPLGDIKLPGIGAVGLESSRNDTPELFYYFTSFLSPSTVYRYDVNTGKSTAFQPPPLPFDASRYETRQVFFASKDGTRVPMFITSQRGIALDGSHPTVLYAYGGNNISTTPSFSPNVAVWLAHGGIYASANIRGGGEYGDAWHRAGIQEKKQKVFDDFIAAAEYLIAQKYTSPAHLAIHGSSNGGLLVAAVEVERPELFAAAYAGAGIMDMLRFDRFSAGVLWVPEYGSPSVATQFSALRKLSPLHNVKLGTCHPATIITTADHDDVVVPLHSYKFAAALQAAQPCDNPVLLRVERNTSHTYMPTDKRIAQDADVWAFTASRTGMRK